MTRPIVFVGYKGDLSMFVDVCTLNNTPIMGIMDKNFLHETELEGIPMLGSEDDLLTTQRHLIDECDFFVSSGFVGVKNADDPSKTGDLVRLERIALLERLGCQFATLIHPTAIIHPTAEVGYGSFVGLLSGLGYKSKMGAHSFINSATFIGHHSQIGTNFIGAARSMVGGHTHIGNNVFLGACGIILEGHWKDPVVIGDNCLIHTSVILLKSIPENTTVGLHGKTYKRYTSPPLPDILAVNTFRT
jgi:acetyltransferase-like isoleucine patch superfamily enzyme